jgi:hypothetical protein
VYLFKGFVEVFLSQVSLARAIAAAVRSLIRYNTLDQVRLLVVVLFFLATKLESKKEFACVLAAPAASCFRILKEFGSCVR